MDLDITPESIARTRAPLNVPPERFPESVAIIMDGNGRWAREHGMPRSLGHKQGADTVHRIVQEAALLGLKALSLYSFSTENWKRPRREVKLLMQLYAERLRVERPVIMGHNIRVRHLGRREGLPREVLDEIDESVSASSRNTGMCLGLAINYGSRDEIVNAVRSIAEDLRDGKIDADEIGDELISARLDTAGMADPDLLIRTAGEMRLSNFLLWQLSYAEIYVTDVYWPEFGESELHKAIQAYASRHRRFGGLDSSNS